MKNNQILDFKEKLEIYNTTLETWKKRKLNDINLIPFDAACTDLIILNSSGNKPNFPTAITIFNNSERISIGLIHIPNQFDEINTQEQFITNFQSFRNQFDALLFKSTDANFTDFGFKEMVSDNKSSTITHYRNPSFDFDNFKEVFKSNSLVIMTTATGFGINRAIEAASSAFVLPDFYNNQIIELKNAMVSVAIGNSTCTNDEVNDIGKYCLNQIKRGATLALDRMEDLSLQNEIRVSVLISGFDSKD
jgi:cell division GTPase FtsZ